MVSTLYTTPSATLRMPLKCFDERLVHLSIEYSSNHQRSHVYEQKQKTE